MRRGKGVPRFWKSTDAEMSFVNDRRIVEVNNVVVRPSMIGNSGAFGRCLHISNIFFFPRGKGSTCFANIIPRATATGDFVDNIGL